jgi:hypothetical protein
MSRNKIKESFSAQTETALKDGRIKIDVDTIKVSSIVSDTSNDGLIIDGVTVDTAKLNLIEIDDDGDVTAGSAVGFNISGDIIKTGLGTEGSGQLILKSKTATKAFAGGATEVIAVAVPSGALLVGAQLRNDTALTATTGVSYSAAYSGGATQAISSGTAFTKNTKVNTFFNVQGSGEATAITSNTTNITLTPNAGTLDTGSVTAVVYYYVLDSLTDAA